MKESYRILAGKKNPIKLGGSLECCIEFHGVRQGRKFHRGKKQNLGSHSPQLADKTLRLRGSARYDDAFPFQAASGVIQRGRPMLSNGTGRETQNLVRPGLNQEFFPGVSR